MNLRPERIYEFGPFRLDPAEHLLLRDGEAIPLTPKAFDLLMALVGHHGHLVEKEELLRLVWPDTFVEEANLSSNISLIRKALGNGSNGQRYIETVSRRGYRFVASVKEIAPESEFPVDSGRRQFPGDELSLTLVTESSERPIGRLKPHQPVVIVSLVAIILVGGGIAYRLSRLIGQQSGAPFLAMEIKRLTHTDEAGRAAISPDGKYVAQVKKDGGRQSLWLRHNATDSATLIVAPAEVNYDSVVFSPDGNYIYYVRSSQPDSATADIDAEVSGALYRVTILGKDEKKLIENVSGSITFSPDGNRLAFVRLSPGQKKSALILANADGSGGKELATRANSFRFCRAPAWSPDGRIIACSVATHASFLNWGVVGVRVADGAETPITTHRWDNPIKGMAWLPDGSGLLVIGSDSSGSLLQIWQLAY